MINIIEPRIFFSPVDDGRVFFFKIKVYKFHYTLISGIEENCIKCINYIGNENTPT